MQEKCSLVPRGLPHSFCSSVSPFALTIIHGCGRTGPGKASLILRPTRETRSACGPGYEARGRPDIIHHVSDVRWTQGGREAVVISAGPEAVHHPVGSVRTLCS